MMNRLQRKTLALTIAICISLAGMAGAMAQAASDFEALEPLMNLIADVAIIQSTAETEAIQGADGTLSNTFISTFFALRDKADPALGLTQEMAENPEQQAAFLTRVFAAQLPTLEPITYTEDHDGFIGFRPVTVNNALDVQGIQIIGEIYRADKPLSQLSDVEQQDVLWLERAIFSFQSDASAMNGFRLTGFAVGTELSMEQAVQSYFDEILVEYVNTSLGFTVQYPSVFTDNLLREDDAGVSAKLPDESASFFAKRVDNVNESDLRNYVDIIANGIPGSKAQFNDELRYATVMYSTDEGFTVFSVYIVTDMHIYQAELSYRTDLSMQYSMYTTYLEYSFMVDEIAMG
ncbi:MAG: hypothetical protein FWF86_06480 [Clostridia bacterium]|nr:hypothetical protein [Clostridia bacterium]